MERLSEEGACVVVFDTNKTAGEGVAADLTATGRNVQFSHVDVSDKKAIAEAISLVSARRRVM